LEESLTLKIFGKIGRLILMMYRVFKNSIYYGAILNKIIPYLLHIALGILKLILKIGKNQMRLGKPIVLVGSIKISI
tara:strand:+ start:134 stop:364 length:231 start_codon:yes stop_codon:yes gene_type:complete